MVFGNNGEIKTLEERTEELLEIGKNITVFESDNDIIIVDCGVAFPDDEMLGIDAVIPDFTYLIEHKNHVKGIFISHGHDDVSSAVGHLIKELDIEVFPTNADKTVTIFIRTFFTLIT